MAGTALLALVSLVPAVGARAQHPAPAAPVVPPDSIHGRVMPEELRHRIEDLRSRRLAEYLRLDEELAREIEAELREFRERQGELRRERQIALDELRRAIEAELNDADLRRRLEALHHNEQERERLLRDLRENLARGLTVEQQARLQLFAERFAREMRDRVELLHERRGALGPRGPEAGRPPVAPAPPVRPRRSPPAPRAVGPPSEPPPPPPPDSGP
ncbi:MAG TPA: hypothetical protein VIC56_08030 [Gemmatimonadota bacterium]|jgi:hypothetical protein